MLDKFISIIWAIIRNPYEYFSSEMPKNNLVREPLIFAAVISCISLLPYVISLAFNPQFGAAIIILFVLLPVFTIAFLYVGAFFIHSEIFLFCPKRSNFKQTLKVLAYSSGANILIVVPVIGALISFVFQIRAAIFGLSAIHNVSALKMFMLFVIIPIILMIAFAALIFAAFGAMLMPYYSRLLSSI